MHSTTFDRAPLVVFDSSAQSHVKMKVKFLFFLADVLKTNSFN